jgi:glycosyltransferase involved in cell wall biosynthesis
MTHIDVVLPLYQEEKILEDSVSRIMSFLDNGGYKDTYTITLVNNGKGDTTWPICTMLAVKYPHVRAINIAIKGKGNAVLQAWRTSSADTLVFMDADLSTELSALPQLITPIIDKSAALVVGNRFGKRSIIISNRKTRKVASKIYNFFVRTLLKTNIPDHQCGFKSIQRSVFLDIEHHLHANDFFFDTELVSIIRKYHHPIASIDVVWTEGKKTSVSLFKDSFKMAVSVLCLYKRLR